MNIESFGIFKTDLYMNARTHIRTYSPRIVLFNMCNALFSCNCTLTGQVFICGHMLMAMYSFVPFREAKFCGVPPCVSDQFGCSADKKSLRKTGLDTLHCFHVTCHLY